MSAQVHFVSADDATYADLKAAPAGYTVDLIGGRLHALPRPKGKHVHSASVLGRRLGRPFEDGSGGPGGWWILDEPEIHWELNRVVTVPELAGWRKEPMPDMPDDHRFTGVPDWLGEILSPTTRDYELNEKVPLHARYSVPFLWLIDPDPPWLAARVLEGESYREVVRSALASRSRLRPSRRWRSPSRTWAAVQLRARRICEAVPPMASPIRFPALRRWFGRVPAPALPSDPAPRWPEDARPVRSPQDLLVTRRGAGS